MSAFGLRVAGIGMTTAVGGTRHGMSMVATKLQILSELGARSADGRPMTGFRATWLGRAGGSQRLVALAREALADDQLMVGPLAGAAPRPIPLLLCLPAPEDGMGSAGEVLAPILEETALTIDRRHSRAVAEGKRGLWPALLEARELIASGRAAACLVGAVDSLVEPARLGRLIQEGRIGPQAEGVIPGEAAVFLLLQAPARGTGVGAVGATIVGLGRSIEAGGGETVTGQGRARAMNQALQEARVAAAQIGALTHDAQTAAQIEELALARARLALGVAAADALRIWTPFTALGETGAAAGLLGLATSAFLTQNSGVDAPTLTVLASNGTERWAAAMAPARRPEQ